MNDLQIASLDAERRFELLVQAVTDYALFMLDADGCVVNWNSGAERAKGYRAEEIVGRHFSVFYTAEDREAGEPTRALATAADAGRYEREGWRLRKDGSRFWAHVVIDAVRDRDGRLLGFAKITRDVTERRQSALALEAAREQLFQSQKLESIGQLTGGIAHDFNNLLTVIKGSLEMAARHGVNDPRLAALLRNIDAAADRAARLTRQLLVFARRGALQPERIDIARQIPAMSEFIGRSLRGDIQLQTDIPPDLANITVDARELELALLNLCLNARDAMKDGGTLSIRVRNLPDGAPFGLSGRHVAIAVSDTGHGIPPALLDKVIEPFFTTKEIGAGTGLGLSQAFGFARQSGGTLHIASTPGEGATVTLVLPASEAAEAQDAAEAHPESAPARIAVVEDDPAVAELAAMFLEQCGYSVRAYERPARLLDVLEHGEHMDLLFSDIMLPGGMNGIELARLLRQRFPRLPILLATGYSEAMARAGAGDFQVLLKPYKFEDLATRVSAMLNSSLESVRSR